MMEESKMQPATKDSFSGEEIFMLCDILLNTSQGYDQMKVISDPAGSISINKTNEHLLQQLHVNSTLSPCVGLTANSVDLSSTSLPSSSLCDNLLFEPASNDSKGRGNGEFDPKKQCAIAGTSNLAY